MKQFILKSLSILLGTCSIGSAKNANFLTIRPGSDQEMIMILDAQVHTDYGMAYPMTYEFSIPQNASGLLTYKRYSQIAEWMPVAEKTSDDFYNAIEAVRFEYDSKKAFVSVGFADSSDTTMIKISDNTGRNIPMIFNRICKYYDGRDAAVSCSADDYANWNLGNFLKTIRNFRSKHLWLSIGVNTAACSPLAFDSLQAELDRGYMEAGAHSRTHPQGPFARPDFEITGCKEDLIQNLNMPALFRNGNHEYVYTWIAPYGYNDPVIESLLGHDRFLANRLYFDGQDFAGFPEWDEQNGLFRPFGVTREVGPVREGFIGKGDSTDLNNAYDQVVKQGGIYFLMCHPSIAEWDKAYTWSHLNHISLRKNIWYVSTGHLFLYHFAQVNYQYNPATVVENKIKVPVDFSLYQNYPNPFNPETVIRYQLQISADVELSVYNSAGQKVAALVATHQRAGDYPVKWNASGLAGGVYLYCLKTNTGLVQTRKMVLLK